MPTDLSPRELEIAAKGEITPGTIHLIYTSDSLYESSGSILSSLYTVDGHRYDYGFLQIALKCGKNVNIRQATPVELKFFIDKLEILKQENQKFREGNKS